MVTDDTTTTTKPTALSADDLASLRAEYPALPISALVKIKKARESDKLKAKEKTKRVGLKAKEALQLAFEGVGGVGALVEFGKKYPRDFYAIWVKIMPAQLQTDVNIKSDVVTQLMAGRNRIKDMGVIENTGTETDEEEKRRLEFEEEYKQNANAAIGTRLNDFSTVSDSQEVQTLARERVKVMKARNRRAEAEAEKAEEDDEFLQDLIS